MDHDAFCRACRGQPGATESVQWGDDLVFKVAGKMFACTGTSPGSRYSFKVDDERFLELTDQPGIVPAPYLARAKWVQLDPAECALGDDAVAALVARSYELVVAKLPKKTQRALAEEA